MNDARMKETILVEGTLKLLSPLLVGDGEKQSELIDMLALQNRDGKAYIPATSIAGVLRHTMGSYLDCYEALEKILTPSEKEQSDSDEKTKEQLEPDEQVELDKKLELDEKLKKLVTKLKDKYLEGESILKEVLKNTLFGSIQNSDSNQSALRFFDVILEDTTIAQRDGVSLAYGTRVAKESALYNYEAIDRGAKGAFMMECVLREGHVRVVLDALNTLKETLKKTVEGVETVEAVEILEAVEAVETEGWDKRHALALLEFAVQQLADILFSGLAVGKFTTKGFGKIQVLDCKSTWYRLKTNDSIRHWLFRTPSTCIYDKVDTASNITPKDETLVMKLSANIASSLLVRTQGDKPSMDSTMLTSRKDYVIPGTSVKDYVIPGSSVKGVIRHHARYILEQMGLWDAWSSSDGGGLAVGTRFEELFGSDNKEADLIKSRVSVNEVYIKQDDKHIVAKPQTRNRIDRFTGGTIDSALFTEEPIWQVSDSEDGTVSIEVCVKDCKPEEVGLFVVLFRDMWMGKLTFGGEASVGRGRIFGVKGSITYKDQTYTFINKKQGTTTAYAVLTDGDESQLKQLNQHIRNIK